MPIGLVEQLGGSSTTRIRSAIAAPPRSRHALRLDVVVDAKTRRIDERDAQPVEVDRLGDQIARRAGHVGDDRARRADQRVEQARLADVRLADDRDLQAFANRTAAPRPPAAWP